MMQVRAEIEGVIDVAWSGYDKKRKSPRTRKAISVCGNSGSPE
jgi:hypothetical protein